MRESGVNILVVDDVPDWRITLAGILLDEGYRVETAGNVAEALELLELNRFDLAIVDVRLDEFDEANVDGLNLAAEIKRQWPSVKIMIITGYGASGTISRAFELRVDGQRLVEGFIAKAETEGLVRAIRDMLS